MKQSPLLSNDFYKTGHIYQYPEGTETIYSNFTPRSSRIPEIKEVVVFGVQAFIKTMVKEFKDEFFAKPTPLTIGSYLSRMDNALGPNNINSKHLEELYELKYLPLEIKALPEGTLCPIGVPMLTIRNTDPRFYWLPNFLETWISNSLWHPMTTATIAWEYRKMLQKFANETSDQMDFIQWQGHDFSMRGHTSLESAIVSGAAHLLSFTGTDTIPSIDFLEEFYNADASKELIGGSVPATEHSVMCAGGNESELETFERLITKVYPQGIVSIVSDTWDYWKVVTQILPTLKDKILLRNGKVVIRPDSGDPVKIICGDYNAPKDSPEYKGTISLLWEVFGGTTNTKGFKQLNSHIGCIYGDSITLDICKQICVGLQEKGFTSTNMVFGIGSYTYQYVTRDTFGFAMKSTMAIINGKETAIYKNPKTDSGIKKSAKGWLHVGNKLTLTDNVSWGEEKSGELHTVFYNGTIANKEHLSGIRKHLLTNLDNLK